MKRKLTTIAGLLSLCLQVSAQEIEIKFPYSKINTGLAKAHNETKKVVIGYFGVMQVTSSAASQKADFGASYAKMTVSFGDVDPKAYQTIVKEGYDLAVKKLTAAGWEVLTAEQIKATGAETFEGDVSEGKTDLHIRPAVTLVKQDMSPLGFNPFLKKAKELGANLINFTYGATAVSFDRGSKFSKKASVSASPYLTFGGAMQSYPIARNGSPVYIQAGTKEGVTDFVGPDGLYETATRKSRYLGNAFGKYTIDIDQAKYLTYIRTMLLSSVEKSVDAWIAGMAK